MSNVVQGLVWQCGRYEGTTLIVLLKLADHANDDGGSVFPGVDSLSNAARIKRRRTQVILRELEADGVIERVKWASGGRRHATEYRINVAVLEGWVAAEKGALGCTLSDAERVQPSAPFSDQKGAPQCTVSDQKGCTPESQRVHSGDLKGALASAPQPSEPSRTSARAREAPPAERGGGASRAPGEAETAKWAAAMDQLKAELGETSYRQWLKPLGLAGVTDGCAVIQAPTRFMRDWVTSHYGDRLRELWGGPIKFVFGGQA